jgi:hypothetical protein
MKYAKWLGWGAAAAGFLYAGRERLAADRLIERASMPYASTAAPADKNASVGGFFDARIASAVARIAWIDYALDTVPPPARPGDPAAPKPAPGKPGAPAASFHWLDTHSNPSVVKEGVGGKAHARRGAGVLIDAQNRRWEIEPRRSTSTAAGADDEADGAPAPRTAPVDPAEIARRKDNAWLALKCAGAASAALLLW